MKIGVLTFHEADNYGAVLQIYALAKNIQNLNENYQVEIINYHMPFVYDSYKLMRVNNKNIISFAKSLLSSILYLKVKTVKKCKFNKFRNEYLNISDNVYTNAKEIKEFDSYIVGSDQVWNSDITNYEELFFLNFCGSSSKKISYAASIGKNKLDKSDMKFFEENINNFDFLSVREANAREMIEPFTDKNIHRVLDPTFLQNKKEWFSLIEKKNNDKSEDYILLYMVAVNEEAFEVANSISKKLGLPVWYINDSYRKDKYGFKHLRSVGPLEFLRLFKNANFVITSSFHGTAFSIIFNKNFVTVPYKKTSSRMTDLLKMLGLYNRIINSCRQINNNFEFEIDYSNSNQILESEKKKSLNFLKKALND